MCKSRDSFHTSVIVKARFATLAISMSQVMSNVEFINRKRQPAMNTLCVQNDTITEVGNKMQRPALWNMYLS